jgi:hypothetical protein
LNGFCAYPFCMQRSYWASGSRTICYSAVSFEGIRLILQSMRAMSSLAIGHCAVASTVNEGPYFGALSQGDNGFFGF